jgi:hypothetical protein
VRKIPGVHELRAESLLVSLSPSGHTFIKTIRFSTSWFCFLISAGKSWRCSRPTFGTYATLVPLPGSWSVSSCVSLATLRTEGSSTAQWPCTGKFILLLVPPFLAVWLP